MSKNAHMRQIEQMESEELLAQKKLRTEVIQLEDMLAQVSSMETRIEMPSRLVLIYMRIQMLHLQ